MKVRPWIAPRWDNETCIVLASGESMSQQVADDARATGFRSIVVNSTFKLAPWADVLYAADALWWEVTRGARDFAGIKVGCDIDRTIVPGVQYLHFTGVEGFDPTPGCVRTGNNSGYQAVHVAAQAGCARILLCGFDMRGGHWHERHPRPLRDHGEGIYGGWIREFNKLAPILERRGVEVINCTPNSALTCFCCMSLDEARTLPAPLGSSLQA